MILRGVTTGWGAIDWGVTCYLASLVGLYSLPLALHALLESWQFRLQRSRPAALEAIGTWGGPVLIAVLCFGMLALHAEATTDFIYFQF